jgi:hypothetical protein
VVNWAEIRDFPGYEVSDLGQVRNQRTQRLMRLSVNQRGFVYVGLMKQGVQRKSSVALLVAREFLKPHKHEAFSSVIHLDGDRLNNAVTNLMWRPTYYAVEYYREFANPQYHLSVKLKDMATGEVYRNSREVASTFGVLEKDVVLAVTNRTYVWPTYQEFGLA